jgi:hypothetical protein
MPIGDGDCVILDNEQIVGESSRDSRNLTDTAISPQQGGSDSTVARTRQATEESLLASGRFLWVSKICSNSLS